MKVKEESGLIFNIQKTEIIAFVPITSWQIEGEKSRSSDRFFLHSKFTEDGDFNHEIKIYLLLGRKSMTNLDDILKSRNITLLTKVHIIKAMFFSSSHVQM